MNTDELKSIDVSETICAMLSRKTVPTIKEISEELLLPADEINGIIIRDDLYYRAAWAKYDKEVESIETAVKKIKLRKLLAEYELKKTLKEMQRE